MNLYAFLITTLAGLSTVIGGLIILLPLKNKSKIISSALGFAAGVMISVSITDLIPNAFSLLSKTYYYIYNILICLIGINIGIVIAILIEKYLPTENIKVNNKKLYRVGIISMFAIIVHNIPEGIATYITTNNNIKLGIVLSIAIALHNIPEGISISLPIYYSTNSKLKALSYTFISGMSELLGALLSYLFLKPYINDKIMAIIYAIIAGMMICISFNNLLPTAKRCNDNKIYMYIFIIIGSLIMIINHLLFS